MSTGFTKGQIQYILRSADTSGNLNRNLNGVLSYLGITGMNTINKNTKNTIVAALRNFKNLKIDETSRNVVIDPWSIIMNEYYTLVVPEYLRQINGSNQMKNKIINKTLRRLQSATRYGQTELASFNNNPDTYIRSLFETLAKNIQKRFFVAGARTYNKNMYKNAQKHPWFIIKYPKTPPSGPFNMFPQLQFHEIDVPGLALPPMSDPVSWKIGWNKTFNGTTYGYLRMNKNQKNNSVLQELVGKFCNSDSFASANPWCSKKATFKYSQNNTGIQNQKKITKSGLSGLGVTELARLLKLSPTGGKRRRYYLDIKRTGDYGQIFSCRYLYDDAADPGYYKAILNPGNAYFAKQYLTKPMTEENLQALTTLEQNGSFYFMYATFCTQDRPAAKFAMLMRIPFIFEKPKNKKFYFGILNDPNDLRVLGYTRNIPTDINKLTGRHIMDIVNHNYLLDSGQIPSKGVYPVWYQLMCIIDTAHDFVIDRLGGGSGARTIVFNVKDLLKGLYTNDDFIVPNPYGLSLQITKLIEVIFSAPRGTPLIKNIEVAASDDIEKFVLRVSNTGTIPAPGQKFTTSFGASLTAGAANNTLNQPYTNNNGTPITLNGLLARFNSCIVLDSTQRKLPPQVLKRISLLAAKYTDPGS